ncbi:MAG TPA: hypothetical protein VEH80_09715 [Candidatus Bathyarchaeia archaeon]|nr:hypothetical protein [Candidatus Bathyarchaeia archaeon]
MGYALAVLTLLLIATVPVLLLAGPSSSLRGLGWLVVLAGGLVLLIDMTDRLAEWIERRRWRGRR